MKKKIIFSLIFVSVIGVITSSFYVNYKESIYALSLESIEALAQQEGTTQELGTCYSYYVLSFTTDENGCEGQGEYDEPKPCKLVAWAVGREGYERKCKK